MFHLDIQTSERNSSSILIFRGGQTRKDVDPTSEGASYYYLAQQMKLIGGELQERFFVEEYAWDSYETLLFSICRFKEVSGVYPSKITVGLISRVQDLMCCIEKPLDFQTLISHMWASDLRITSSTISELKLVRSWPLMHLQKICTPVTLNHSMRSDWKETLSEGQCPTSWRAQK